MFGNKLSKAEYHPSRGVLSILCCGFLGKARNNSDDDLKKGKGENEDDEKKPICDQVTSKNVLETKETNGGVDNVDRLSLKNNANGAISTIDDNRDDDDIDNSDNKTSVNVEDENNGIVSKSSNSPAAASAADNSEHDNNFAETKEMEKLLSVGISKIATKNDKSRVNEQDLEHSHLDKEMLDLEVGQDVEYTRSTNNEQEPKNNSNNNACTAGDNAVDEKVARESNNENTKITSNETKETKDDSKNEKVKIKDDNDNNSLTSNKEKRNDKTGKKEKKKKTKKAENGENGKSSFRTKYGFSFFFFP